ncbi:SAM-dependent methyltransferase [Amycolatopsis sp. cmx-4-54]|uniref:SAM-dependent methyltransferase n=1 Tax=Amycolatopsis sp. cmx-4-54 TaxID=2790936 RepID=UPI00397BF7C5
MTELGTISDELGKMYDQTTPLSIALNDGQEHLAYWYGKEDDTTVFEAAQRITRKVADTLYLRPGERLLDAGCGVGAPAVLVAKETGALVTGITVSAAQVAEGERRAFESGLSRSVRFERGDYQSIAYPDGSFDAIMAIESLMHAPDLDAVLAEFHRVLRPGGRLALSDCTREPGMSDDEFVQLSEAFKMHCLLTIPQWVETLKRAGFVVEEYIQCGPRVYGMGLRYLDRANELQDELVSDFGEEAIENLKQGYRNYFGAGGERMGYGIIAARKPAEGRCCAKCGTTY